MRQIKQAIFLTGAAARISQEVALLDKLILNMGLNMMQDNTLLAGFSSGSLNLTAINGAFSNNPAFDWDLYYKREILFNLTNDDVFKGRLFHKSFSILDTFPLRKTINHFLDKMNVVAAGDFAFASYILAFADKYATTEWAYSLNEGNKNLNVSDLLMASTAIPFLFPSQKIGSPKLKKRNFPRCHFSDGGTGGTFKRFDKILECHGKLDTMYIISPMREKNCEEVMEHYNQIQNTFSQGFHIKLKDSFINISLHTFLAFLKKLKEWNDTHKNIAKIYVCIPSMENNFPILDFSQQEKQYNAVCKWVDDHPQKLAVDLDCYLKEHHHLLKEAEVCTAS